MNDQELDALINGLPYFISPKDSKRDRMDARRAIIMLRQERDALKAKCEWWMEGTRQDIFEFSACRAEVETLRQALARHVQIAVEQEQKIEALRTLLISARKWAEFWSPNETNVKLSERPALNNWYDARDRIDAVLGRVNK